MSASKSSYLRTQMIKAALKATPFTGAATLYMALHTGSPGLAGANEVAGNGYARVVISVGAEASGQVSNNIVVTFTGPTPANWGTLTHFSIWDAAAAGNMYYEDQLANPIVTSVNIPVSFPVGNVVVAET